MTRNLKHRAILTLADGHAKSQHQCEWPSVDDSQPRLNCIHERSEMDTQLKLV